MLELKPAHAQCGAHQAAAYGARFLDTRRRSWADEIDVTVLDLERPEHCVLGQLYGTYERGAAELFLTEEQSCLLGFYAPPGVVFITPFLCDDCGEQQMIAVREWGFEELTNAWREEIQKRRCATRGRIVVGGDGTAELEGKALAAV